MNTFLKIALRNVLRNKYRSAITISAIAFGLCALIFLKGFIDGANHQMVSNYTDILIGHIQIHSKGFQKSMGLERSISDPEELEKQFRDNSSIASYSPRIKDFALISSPESAHGVLLLGVDPAKENKVSSIHKKIREGVFLQENDDDKIVIGKDLAENLKVGIADKAVIMSQGADGSLAASAFTICGIIETGAEETDKNLAIISLAAAQELLVLDNKISGFVIKLDSLYKVDSATAEIRKSIDSSKYEALSWKDISPMTYQWLQFDQVFTSLILVIFLIVVASGILNTILMAVLERTREFGIMLALGTKKIQVISMVITESFILSVTGVIFGSISGIALVNYFGRNGINLAKFSNALDSFYIGSIIYTKLDWVGFFISLFVILLVSSLISLFPAWKAANLKPIEAIRHI